MGAETRSMKRKRSVDEPAVPWKKVAKERALEPPTPEATTPKALAGAPLIQTLRQYGLLESITTCLLPADLLSLSLSCKATYNAMFPRPGSLDNLLSRVQCSGHGVSLRQSMHKKSRFFDSHPCTEFVQCGTVSRRQNVGSKPCISCKVMTCNECRIHCVYQAIYEEPSHPEELGNFSGFVLLTQPEVAILSLQHLPAETESPYKWKNPATDSTAGPYHDQGFLDMALESDEAATPEKISDVLDVDLGRVSLTTWSSSSQFGFPSPVLRTFCDIVEQRKLFLCEDCSMDAAQGYKAITPGLPALRWLKDNINADSVVLPECHCSLRSRILDRWQCVKCYAQEELTINNIARNAPNAEKQTCRCGFSVKKTVCMWCWGEIVEGRDVYEGVPAYIRELFGR